MVRDVQLLLQQQHEQHQLQMQQLQQQLQEQQRQQLQQLREELLPQEREDRQPREEPLPQVQEMDRGEESKPPQTGDEVPPETLETLFEGLQRSISTQFREQQRAFNSRWEKERSRAEENGFCSDPEGLERADDSDGEQLSATEIERLAQAAFCECPLEIRDKLAVSQFVSSLANEEMKRMLRLGGFTSLRAAVIRALEIEAVESMANAPVTKKETSTKPVYSSERDSGRREMRRPVKRKLERQEMECWNCKEKGHMWRNCPKKRKEEF
ncbi:transcriptional corepressor LEUNIG-like [Osmia bicornis bicornis]|uniref:transcriptional corepressor LEUNIG-like n=1 Tax=Osmia bicornis bicornis TaxID=1437191 RepID=UPI001EAEA441|nr:transcriptional corepressor LEUNIG-like [Osmia bicornis bicornis]